MSLVSQIWTYQGWQLSCHKKRSAAIFWGCCSDEPYVTTAHINLDCEVYTRVSLTFLRGREHPKRLWKTLMCALKSSSGIWSQDDWKTTASHSQCWNKQQPISRTRPPPASLNKMSLLITEAPVRSFVQGFTSRKRAAGFLPAKRVFWGIIMPHYEIDCSPSRLLLLYRGTRARRARWTMTAVNSNYKLRLHTNSHGQSRSGTRNFFKGLICLLSRRKQKHTSPHPGPWPMCAQAARK